MRTSWVAAVVMMVGCSSTPPAHPHPDVTAPDSARFGDHRADAGATGAAARSPDVAGSTVDASADHLAPADSLPPPDSTCGAPGGYCIFMSYGTGICGSSGACEGCGETDWGSSTGTLGEPCCTGSVPWCMTGWTCTLTGTGLTGYNCK